MSANYAVSPNKHFFKMFRTAADSYDMAVNSTGADFKVTGPDTGPVEIERINIVIVDAGIGYGEFGGIGSALTNGISIKCFDANDNEIFDYLDGITIKANEDWGLLAGVDSVSLPAAGDDSLPIRWTIGNSGARTELLPGEYIRVRVQDNLTGLSKFMMMAQGIAR